MPAPGYIVALLLSALLALGAWLQPRADAWAGARGESRDLMTLLLGDARRLFASHFFVKADVYFHSGYYPTIFDGKQLHERPHMAEQTGHDDHAGHDHAPGHDEHEGHDHAPGEPCDDIFGPPRDWVDRFGRNFIVSAHTHLPKGRQREMLPWLRLAASLDPQRVENFTVAAFWLRTQLGKVDDAEQFLREGWRLNPRSPEILFELGQLYYQNRKDATRARNVWELGLRYWREREAGREEPDTFLAEQLLANLAQLEYDQQRWQQSLTYLMELKRYSPIPESIQKQIDALREKIRP